MTYLLKFISYPDNVLKYNKKILDVKTIANLLGREYESTRQLTKKLLDKGVLALIKIESPTFVKSQANHTLKAYIFNPYIAVGDRQVSGYVYSIFQKFGWGIKKCMMNTDVSIKISDIKEEFNNRFGKSYLYIIQNEDNNYVKIGVTNNIDRRLTELQTASDSNLNIVYMSPKCDNAYELERRVHDHFSAYRKNGEWFSISPCLGIAYIESLFDNANVADK